MASRKDPRKAGNAPPQRAGPAPQAKVAYDPTALKAADKLIPKTKLREVLLRDGHEERRIQSFRGSCNCSTALFNVLMYTVSTHSRNNYHFLTIMLQDEI